MTLALRYIILGFVTAAALQLFRDPPTWALFVAFGAGTIFGVLFTVLQMYFCDLLEKYNL